VVKVERTRVYEVSPQAMWGTIGDFHGIHNWHPAFVGLKSSEDGAVRELILADDAGSVFETQLDAGDLHYTYRIDESPFPIKDVVTTLMVREGGDGGSEVVWSAEFEPDGVTEEEATELLGGFYDAGFDSL
jgi:hypothetical protein